MKFPKLAKKLNIKIKTIKDTTDGEGGVVKLPKSVKSLKVPSAMSIHPSESIKELGSERQLKKFKNLQRYLKSSS